MARLDAASRPPSGGLVARARRGGRGGRRRAGGGHGRRAGRRPGRGRRPHRRRAPRRRRPGPGRRRPPGRGPRTGARRPPAAPWPTARADLDELRRLVAVGADAAALARAKIADPTGLLDPIDPAGVDGAAPTARRRAVAGPDRGPGRGRDGWVGGGRRARPVAAVGRPAGWPTPAWWPPPTGRPSPAATSCGGCCRRSGPSRWPWAGPRTPTWWPSTHAAEQALYVAPCDLAAGRAAGGGLPAGGQRGRARGTPVTAARPCRGAGLHRARSRPTATATPAGPRPGPRRPPRPAPVRAAGPPGAAAAGPAPTGGRRRRRRRPTAGPIGCRSWSTRRAGSRGTHVSGSARSGSRRQTRATRTHGQPAHGASGRAWSTSPRRRRSTPARSSSRTRPSPRTSASAPTAARPSAGPGDGTPGRTSGFCAACRNPFDFVPKLRRGEIVGRQYEVMGCLAHGGLGLDLPGPGQGRERPVGRAQGPARLRRPGGHGGRGGRAPVPGRARPPRHRRHLQLRHRPGRRLHRHGVRRRPVPQADAGGPAGGQRRRPRPAARRPGHRLRAGHPPRLHLPPRPGPAVLRLQARQPHPGRRRGEADRPGRGPALRRPRRRPSTARSGSRRPRSPRWARRWRPTSTPSGARWPCSPSTSGATSASCSTPARPRRPPGPGPVRLVPPAAAQGDAPHPDDRFQTVAELGEQMLGVLREFVALTTGSPRRCRRPSSGRSPTRRPRPRAACRRSPSTPPTPPPPSWPTSAAGRPRAPSRDIDSAVALRPGAGHRRGPAAAGPGPASTSATRPRPGPSSTGWRRTTRGSGGRCGCEA